MFLSEVVTDVSRGQEVESLCVPTGLLYNGFLVGEPKWRLCGQGRLPQEAQAGVLAQGQPPPVSVLLWFLQFPKSLSYQR